MKPLFIALIVLLIASADIQSQTKSTTQEESTEVKVEHILSEFGLVLQSRYYKSELHQHFGGLLVKLRGMYLGDFQSCQ